MVAWTVNVDCIVSAAELEPLPLVLTVREFAQLARKGRNWGYEQVQTGQVRAVRLGRTIRIPRHEALRALGLDVDENSDDRGS